MRTRPVEVRRDGHLWRALDASNERSEGVREIAALLGVRYRQLPGNEISHSRVIALLDQSVVIIERMEDAGGDSAQLLAATIKAARTGTPHAAR